MIQITVMKFLIRLTCISLCALMATQSAHAALITTEQVAAHHMRTQDSTHQKILTLLQRADVAQALADRGVSPAQARARVMRLTDAEAQTLAADIDRAPAGAGGLIGTVILVTVLLMFTDIMGYTHLFPFLHKEP
jgi:hypothetical protein